MSTVSTHLFHAGAKVDPRPLPMHIGMKNHGPSQWGTALSSFVCDGKPTQISRRVENRQKEANCCLFVSSVKGQTWLSAEQAAKPQRKDGNYAT